MKLSKHFPYLVFLLVAVILLDSLPLFYATLFLRAPWEEISTVLAPLYYGTTYYNARLREIQDGYPFFGNPYYLEHRSEFSPASFGADWLAAIPLWLGASLNTALIFNSFLWSVIFVLLVYFVSVRLGLSPSFSVLAALLTFSQGYFLIVRSPVSMQTIFPFLLLFYLAYLNWLFKPDSWKAGAVLAFSIAVPFYVYTFLWQAVAITAVTTFLFLWLKDDKQLTYQLFFVGAMAFLLALPMGWYMWQQASRPFYLDTIQRFGIINTRLPTFLAFDSGKWILISLLLWFISWRYIKELQTDPDYRRAFSFFGVTGFALLAANFSNVFTGKDMELPIHIERFIAIWLPISFTSNIYFLNKYRNVVWQLPVWRKLVLVVLATAGIAGFWHYGFYWPSLNFIGMGEALEREAAIQKTANWLEGEEKEPVVVLTGPLHPAAFATPVYSKHYVLFSSNGRLHYVSSAEVEDRYLIASYFFRPVTLEKIKEDFVIYAGLGNAVHRHQTHNRRVRLCNMFRLTRFGVSCGKLETAVSLRGNAYFEELYRRYTAEISPKISEKLRQYQVKYILFDKSEKDTQKYFEERLRALPVQLAYEDDNYRIYKVY